MDKYWYCGKRLIHKSISLSIGYQLKFIFLLGYFALFYESNLFALKKKQKSIVIASVVNKSSDIFSRLSQEYGQGLSMAISEVHSGKYYLDKFEILEVDSENDPKKTYENLASLIELKKIRLMVGGFSHSVCLKLSELAQEKKIFYFVVGCQSPVLTSSLGHPYIARTSNNDELKFRALADYIRSKTSLRKWAYIASSKDENHFQWEIFWKHTQSISEKSHLISEKKVRSNTKNFLPIVAHLKKSQPDLIFDGTSFPSRSDFLGQSLKSSLFDTAFYVTSDFDQQMMDEKISRQVNGFVSGFPWYDQKMQKANPEILKWVQRYDYRYGKKPSLYSSWGYQTGYTLLQIVLRSKSLRSEKIGRIVREGFDITLPNGKLLPFGHLRMRGCDQQVLPDQWLGRPQILPDGELRLRDIQIINSILIAASCLDIMNRRQSASLSGVPHLTK